MAGTAIPAGARVMLLPDAANRDPFPGIPPGANRGEARLRHLFEFRDGLISRENAWTGPFLPRRRRRRRESRVDSAAPGAGQT